MKARSDYARDRIERDRDEIARCERLRDARRAEGTPRALADAALHQHHIDALQARIAATTAAYLAPEQLEAGR